MKAIYDTTMADAEVVLNERRDRHLSADGEWRSFPKVPNLLQYVIAGTYYARCKVNGKPVRASLDTDVFSVAKQRLPDKIKELRKPEAEVGTFADGRLQFEQQTRCDHTLAELSKVYRLADAIRSYEPSRPIRFARLIPFKDEICDFRRRGVSFETIAILLKSHSIETSYETVRKFYRQVVEQKNPKRRRRGRPKTPRRQAAAKLQLARPLPPSAREPTIVKNSGVEGRGPRIARVEDL